MKKLLLVFLLSGCAAPMTQEQRAQAIISRLSPHCEAMGYARNTDPWRQCIQKMYAVAVQENAQQQSGGYQYCSKVAGGVACLPY